MSTAILAQSQAFKTPVMALPEEPVAMPVIFDFTTDPAQTLTKDLAQELAALKIPFVQCVFIDNSDDAIALTLEFNDGLFEITVKGNTQGFYPVVVAEGVVRITAISTASAVKKTIILLSMMVPPIQWATA